MEVNSDISLTIDKVGRLNLFTAYACCDIIIKSKDLVPPYKSITAFVKQMAACLMVNSDEIRKLTIQELSDLKDQILNKLYK